MLEERYRITFNSFLDLTATRELEKWNRAVAFNSFLDLTRSK